MVGEVGRLSRTAFAQATASVLNDTTKPAICHPHNRQAQALDRLMPKYGQIYSRC